MNYFNTQQNKDENNKITYTLTHVTDDKKSFRTIQNCARLIVDNKVNDAPFSELPFSIGETIYWLIGDITDRQVKDLCVIYDEEWDIGVVKFTVYGYIYTKNRVAIMTKEIPYQESLFCLTNNDEIFSSLELAEAALDSWTMQLIYDKNSREICALQ